MIPASPASTTFLDASRRVQTDDPFLLEDERHERVYHRRKTRFLILQQQQDVSNDRLFLLGDNKPWQVFRNGYTSGRLQRRKLVFEHSGNFPTLHQACVTGDRDQVRALLSTPEVCVLERDACGRVALHHAVISEQFKIVKRLLRRRDAKLQVHVRDNSSRTALHYALEKLELLALDGRRGQRAPALRTAEVRVESKRYRRLWELSDRMLEMFSRTVLEAEWSVDAGSGESIKELDMHCRGDMWDVCRSGDLERLEMIIKIYGCTKGEWELRELKRTLLHEACENQQMQIVHFLISTMDIPVLAQDASGCTVLHCAARRGFLDVCQMLLAKSPADCGEENLQLNEHAEELVHLQDVRGRTVLHWCLLGCGDPLTRLQIAAFIAQSCPAALHICDQDGISPLHLAIWRGEIELVQRFISLGANVCGSSARIPSRNHDEDVEKASWAPCGIVFQRRHLHKVQKIVPAENTSDAVSSPVCGKKNAPNWENLQHPVEALWYWTQQSGVHNTLSKEKMTESKHDEYRDSESVVTEEELGCRKYGGICSRCKISTANDSSKLVSFTPKEYQLLPPLLLALRVCALKWGNESMLDYRVAIVELLLMNGAPPDELDDDENTSRKAKQDPSALSEGLRASLRYPQIIPMLLQHGAKQVSIHNIVGWCFSASSTEDAAKQVERVFFQLLNLEHVASSSEFLAMVFHHKHFTILHDLVRLWSQKPQNITSEKDATVASDDEHNCCRIGSPWKCIYEVLVLWSKPRKKPEGVGNIDINHLVFLNEFVYPVLHVDNTADGGDALHDRCAWQLFEYCIDINLRRGNGCHSNFDFNPKPGVESIEKREQVVLRCIRNLLKHWELNDGNDRRIKSKAAIWLEPTIFLGYFDCALVLLETLHRFGDDNTLLDTVFEFYSSAVGSRRCFEDGHLRHHREFLLVCAENLLKVDLTTGEKQTPLNSPRSTAVASARSIVHMCANNLPFVLVKSCFDTVFPDSLTDGTQGKSNLLAMIKSIRVGGKTMVQWVVVHARSDILRWILAILPTGLERGSCWSVFVAASSRFLVSGANGEGSSTSTSFIDILFSVYSEYVHNQLTISEREDLLVSLMVQYAIPTDSVALLEHLVNCWGSINSDSGDANKTEHFALFPKQVGVLHSIVRWNAVQVAEFCLSGRCSYNKLETNRVDWQRNFIEESLHRHELDQHTPPTLCQLLGHNHLYNLLSSRLFQASLSEAKTDGDTGAVEPNELESAKNTDTEEEEPTGLCQVGLLRSILDINEHLMAKSTVVESFRGYHRCARIQDPWLSAVTMDQVSYLQALSLTRRQCSDPAVSVRMLVLTAIKNASLNALKWILEANAPVTKHLSDEEGVECLNAAAKHPGVAYAEMTLLLLENQLGPGRLSGDGMGVPLLHRAACFSNARLACRIMTMLLERSDCDMNALDAFGNTAVSYALAAGCLHNACFLIQNSKCRLEAEYEGQSCFYYVLHIAPSFASRTIVRELLVAKRDRAFLHCDADNKTCGCKSYEHPREGEDSDGVLTRPCGFCGHEFTSHCNVPFPSWFRDQYDTYVAPVKLPRKCSHSSSDEGDDSDWKTSQQYLADNKYDVAGDEDEEIVLENGRGRLDVELLRRITVLRYDDILQANGLSVTVASTHTEDAMESNDPMDEETVSDNCGSTSLVSTENEPVLEDCVTMKELLAIVAEGAQRGANECVDSNGETISSICRTAKSSRNFTDYPWWLQQELAMVHSLRCSCQKSALVINRSQLVHVVICRWLRRTVSAHVQQQHTTMDRDRSPPSVTESSIIVLASVQPAFEHWRDVARLDKRSLTEAVPRSPKLTSPLPRILSSVLFHWRHGKEFLAFQRWKNYQTSAEVTHHRLATRLEHVAAYMRRNRFKTLQLRQQQLQDSSRSLLKSSP